MDFKPKLAILKSISLVMVLSVAFSGQAPAASAAVPKTFTTAATSAPTSVGSTLAWDLDTGSDFPYPYTNWWCLSVDGGVPVPQSAWLLHTPANKSDPRDSATTSWGNALYGSDTQTETCWISSYFAMSSATVLVNLAALSAGNHSAQIYVRSCPSGFSSCAVSDTEIASNQISLTLQLPTPVPVVSSHNTEDFLGYQFFVTLGLNMTPFLPNVNLKDICVTIDGAPLTRSMLASGSPSFWLPSIQSAVNGCIAPDPTWTWQMNKDFQVLLDKYKFATGTHTVQMTATLTDLKSVSTSTSFSVSTNLPPLITQITGAQGLGTYDIAVPISWPFSLPASASIDWLVDNVKVATQSITPGSATVNFGIDKSYLPEGPHEFRANLTTSDGTNATQSTSDTISARIPNVQFSSAMDSITSSGSMATIAGTIQNMDRFAPASVAYRTMPSGGVWSAWKVARVLNSNFSAEEQVTKNTSVQVQVFDNWNDTTYAFTKDLPVGPKKFAVTQAVKRTKIRGFLQGSVVTYTVKTDTNFNGMCVAGLETKNAFNFALVWLGSEEHLGFFKLKKGIGSGKVTVKFNGIYKSTLICSQNGFADTVRAGQFVFGVSH